MNEINKMTMKQLQEAYRKKELSPVEVMKSTLDRIEETKQVNAFMPFDPDFAMDLAKQSEERLLKGEALGALEGIPISIKDLMDVKGMPTRNGTKTTNAEPVDEDCDAVACLRAKGALIYAKTTTSEFANKIVTESPLTGVTRNPWNVDHNSGGSSGGAAVSVALGVNPVGIGTDGGGSIRIPSCWNGVVGYKPSGNLVPGRPTDHRMLSHIGPITRSVEDAANILTILADHNCRDWHVIPPRGIDYAAGLDKGIKGLKIAFTLDHGMGLNIDPQIEKAVREAVEVLKGLGAQIVELEKTPLKNYLDNNIHGVQWITYLDQTIRQVPERDRRLIDPDCLDLAAVMEYHSKTKFVDALAERAKIADAMHRFFDDYDVLVTPTFHVNPPKVPGLPESISKAPPLTSCFNQTLQPACSVPCGFSTEGNTRFPVGLQIISRRFNDELVLQTAYAYEQARGAFPMPPEPGMPSSKGFLKGLFSK